MFNICRISGRKSALRDRKKHVLATLSGNPGIYRVRLPGAITPNFCVSAHDPSLIFRFYQDPFRFGADITEKPIQDPPPRVNAV